MRHSNLRGILELFAGYEREKQRRPDLVAEYNDSLRHIQERLGRLDPEEENVARLRWLDALQIKQVANEFGVTEKVIALRIEKIKKRVRHMLSGEFSDGQIVGNDSTID